MTKEYHYMDGNPSSFDTQELCGKLDEARGYNMNTVSGLPVWPADPRPEDIRIEDIAGALSRVCRYNGHLKDGCWRHWSGAVEDKPAIGNSWFPFEVYSVAQHSVLVEQKVREWVSDRMDYSTWSADYPPKHLLLAALLHDAHEYVLGDMVKPQKKMYNNRKLYEGKWDISIAERFGFDVQLFDHPAIKEADYRMFLTEKRDLVNCSKTDFGEAKAEPYPEQIVPVLPSAARRMFLDRFNELYKGE